MSDAQYPPGSAGKILHLFEEGKRFTEELLKENEKLRLVIGSLKNDVGELQAAATGGELVALKEEVERLRRENDSLKERFSSIEVENREFADRYVEVERQNSDLINLYVASYRLHSTMDYDEVVRIVKEIVINMVGSEMFGVFALDEGRRELVRIADEGLDASWPATVPLGQGVLGRSAESGEVYVAPDHSNPHRGSTEPIACIPLKVGERVLGAIAIFGLLVQKDGFHPVDLELFEFLGGHAATAIYVSKLYSLSERKRSTLQGFIDLLRADLK